MIPTANFIATVLEAKSGKPMKVLDVAAGHGMFGVTLAKENPNAHVTALDWPAVLEVAKENAEKHGVANRDAVRSGSAFETELGSDYDCGLLTKIFHHFDIPTCEMLMRRVHTALKPGGKPSPSNLFLSKTASLRRRQLPLVWLCWPTRPRAARTGSRSINRCSRMQDSRAQPVIPSTGIPERYFFQRDRNSPNQPALACPPWSCNNLDCR
jgi:hypothetical protein